MSGNTAFQKSAFQNNAFQITTVVIHPNITDTVVLPKPIDFVLGEDYTPLKFSHSTVENPSRKVTRTRRTLGGEVIK